MLISKTSKKTKARQSLFGKRKALKQFAIISPENPMGKNLSYEENAKRRKAFDIDLGELGVKAFKVKDVYNNKENSYIIFNISFSSAEKLSRDYDQESFIFAKVKGENEVEFELWLKKVSEEDKDASFKDKQHELKEVQTEVLIVNDAKDFYTSIGRTFKFKIPFKFFEEVENYDNIFDEKCLESKKYEESYQKLIEESVSDAYTCKHQMFARSKLYGTLFKSIFPKTEDLEFNF